MSSTLREANDRGFDCLVVDDATAAASSELHRFAIESVKMEGGIFGTVSCTQDVLDTMTKATLMK